jgi:hypothetical protein
LLALAIILLGGLLMAGMVILLRNRDNGKPERADPAVDVSRKEGK